MFNADLIRTMRVNSTPKCAEDISNRIVCYGGFLKALNDIVNFINTDYSSFAILRGNTGYGKKSLIREAERNFLQIGIGKNKNLIKKDLRVIYLNPFLFHDDYGAIKHVAKELGMKIKPSVNEILCDLTERKGLKDRGKIVIILLGFEEFCRQKQSLLYSLTNLSQHGENINILGVTSKINCTSALEKRVRSRLNAVCYQLKLPYSSKEEYVEFASELLGKFKISGLLKTRLEELYMYGTRSIIDLKRFLISSCEWDERGNMSVHQPKDMSKSKMCPLLLGSHQQTTEVLRWLTKPQFELIKMIICYCHITDSLDVCMNDLSDWISKRNIRNFDTTSSLAYKNLATLMQICLISETKHDSILNGLTKFNPEISPQEMRRFLETNQGYCNIQTDQLWKEIR